MTRKTLVTFREERRALFKIIVKNNYKKYGLKFAYKYSNGTMQMVISDGIDEFVSIVGNYKDYEIIWHNSSKNMEKDDVLKLHVDIIDFMDSVSVEEYNKIYGKYYLRCNLLKPTVNYLLYNTSSDSYIFHNKTSNCLFTSDEIENLPSGFKKMIDDGFIDIVHE